MEEESLGLPWKADGYAIRRNNEFHAHGKKRNSLRISSASYSNKILEIHGSLELPDPKAHRDFILRACNAHYDLLEAAEDFVAKVESGRAHSVDSYKKFKAAIAKAGGE